VEDDDELGAAITQDTLVARLAFRDVGRRATRGATREELIADYPELRDDDIELACRFTDEPSTMHFDGLPPFEEARFRRAAGTESIVVSDFDRWVGANSIPDTFEYSKGWWDYVEVVRRLASHFDTNDVRVIGHYVVETPPPCERLPMPAVAIVTPTVTFALRCDFGSWSLKHRDICEWVLSVRRRTPYRGPLFGLVEETQDLRALQVDGLTPEYLFGSYRHDQGRFSCLVRNEWDLVTLIRILAWNT
jgi:hypothetical protein